MGAGWFTIFWRVTFPHIKWSLLYGVVLCTARAMGSSGRYPSCRDTCGQDQHPAPAHRDPVQRIPLQRSFAVSSILVILALLVLVLRSLIEHRGRKGGLGVSGTQKHQQELCRLQGGPGREPGGGKGSLTAAGPQRQRQDHGAGSIIAGLEAPDSGRSSWTAGPSTSCRAASGASASSSRTTPCSAT